MKLLRRILCLFVLSLFFLFGICVADRQRLNHNVLGICITANSAAEADEILNNISELQYKDPQELCEIMEASGIGRAVQQGKQYFEGTLQDGGVVPAGVYDSVCIHTASGTTVYKFLLGGKIALSDKPHLAKLQSGYATILSVVGKAERFIFEFQK